MENEKQISKERMHFLANIAFEEESQKNKDFLERNINEIVEVLQENKTTESEFLDRFQEEIEKFTEYLEGD